MSERSLIIQGHSVDAEAIDLWLLAKPYILWGDFDVSARDRREQAVDWFIDQIEELQTFLGIHEPVRHNGIGESAAFQSSNGQSFLG